MWIGRLCVFGVLAVLSAGPAVGGGAAEPGEPAPDARKQAVALSTGTRMHYIEAGRADGPAVILLHGYTDTSRSFLPTIEALLAGGTPLHLYALDQRGHGATSMPPAAECAAAPLRCFAMPQLAADVLAFMDALAIPRAHLVGHSMGSAVAQEVALSHPDRVESLILIGAIVDGSRNPVLNDFLLGATLERTWRPALERSRPGFRWPLDAYLLTPRDADPEAERWMTENWVADPTADPRLLAAILPETLDTRLGTWLGAIQGQVAFDSRERLAQLRVPALVLWASQDGFFPASPDQAALRTALDAAVAACRTRYLFKTYGRRPLPASGQQETDLGHNTQWGAPETVAADIEAFVTTGVPTPDLPYADPDDARLLRVEAGGARILRGEPGQGCPADRGSLPARSSAGS